MLELNKCVVQDRPDLLAKLGKDNAQILTEILFVEEHIPFTANEL